MNTSGRDAQRRITEHFDHFAPNYHDVAFDGAGMTELSRRDLQIVDRACDVAGSGRACDVGIGSGRITGRLLAKGFDVCGVDASAGMLDQARARVGPAVELVHASLSEQLPLPDSEFDLVTCLRVLKYLPDWPAAVGELARIARPGAVVCFDLANHRSVARFGYPDGMVWPTSHERAIRAATSARLEIIDVVPGVHLPDPLWRSARSRSASQGVLAAEGVASWLLRSAAARSWTFLCRTT